MSGPTNDNARPEPTPLHVDGPGVYQLPLCLPELKLLLGEDIVAIEATTLQGAIVQLPFPKRGLEALGHLVAAALTEDAHPELDRGPPVPGAASDPALVALEEIEAELAQDTKTDDGGTSK